MVIDWNMTNLERIDTDYSLMRRGEWRFVVVVVVNQLLIILYVGIFHIAGGRARLEFDCPECDVVAHVSTDFGHRATGSASPGVLLCQFARAFIYVPARKGGHVLSEY